MLLGVITYGTFCVIFFRFYRECPVRESYVTPQSILLYGIDKAPSAICGPDLSTKVRQSVY